MMFTNFQTPSILYHFYSPGCVHCAEAAPHLQAFEREHRRTVSVIRLNVAAKPDWSIKGYSPRATPAYALVRDGELIAKHEGKLTEAQLKRFAK